VTFLAKPVGAEICAPLRRAALLVMIVPMPLLAFFFAVAVGINHHQPENYHTADRQNDDDWLILPYLADKLGYVRIHAQRAYTSPAKNGNGNHFWRCNILRFDFI
jgi:hypothetical protein